MIEDRGFPEYGVLAGIVLRALEKEPLDRFQTGQKFIHALRQYMQKAGLVVSQLKFSDFLMENFGESLLRQRRDREQSLQYLAEHQQELDAPAHRDQEERADAILATFSELDDETGPQKLPLNEGTETGQEPDIRETMPQDLRKSMPTLSLRLGTDEKEKIASRALKIVIVIALAAVAALAYLYFS